MSPYLVTTGPILRDRSVNLLASSRIQKIVFTCACIVPARLFSRPKIGTHTYRCGTERKVTATSVSVEIRAAQRTFEGAYMRTALSQFSFALIILKIFTSEFYAIGALFASYGAAVLLCAIYRRYQGNTQFFTTTGDDGETKNKFRTSGNSVLFLTLLSVGAYITLIVLTWRLDT
ncbi:hypothetical protein F5B20DRAFT_577288 [Whalleya microplaca]|nr:hypothetical protein F5B20DRAFT_577288 [Whalleya microplaca]